MTTQALPSGRNHHAVKITIYLTPEELHALDSTVLEVRRRSGKRVDRGRYVREAIALSSLSRIAQRIREAD